MTTYGAHLVDKLTQVDAAMLADHTLLLPGDEVFFWREYTSGRDYSFGPGNDLISNLKKKPSSSNRYELQHKQRVIDECARFFAGAINPAWLDAAAFVPVPGSKAEGHPDFDDRIERILASVRPNNPLNVRRALRQRTSRLASHEAAAGQRPTPDELRANYDWDEASAADMPRLIGVVDDVLTAGSHFRAVHGMLRDRYHNARIVGFFIARRVFPPDTAI